MVSWNEIHGHVTQRFQALFLLVCSCKTFLPSDDTVLVKMHHHDTIFKKMHQGTTPRVTWCVKFGSCAHRCEMPRAFCGGACHRQRWWSLARVCNKCKCPQREEEGGSCSGESWSYNGIHWVAESLAPERISSMRNVPSESFRISRGSWNLPPSLGICLSERGHRQGMALEALHWFAQNAQSQIDWKVSHYW